MCYDLICRMCANDHSTSIAPERSCREQQHTCYAEPTKLCVPISKILFFPRRWPNHSVIHLHLCCCVKHKHNIRLYYKSTYADLCTQLSTSAGRLLAGRLLAGCGCGRWLAGWLAGWLMLARLCETCGVFICLCFFSYKPVTNRCCPWTCM